MTVEKDGKASLIEAGKILVSVGRKANLGQAGLDKLNVELLRNGVKVDEHMQTSHPRVYACGDITAVPCWRIRQFVRVRWRLITFWEWRMR
mgnify:CR=1 FL=1